MSFLVDFFGFLAGGGDEMSTSAGGGLVEDFLPDFLAGVGLSSASPTVNTLLVNGMGTFNNLFRRSFLGRFLCSRFLFFLLLLLFFLRFHFLQHCSRLLCRFFGRLLCRSSLLLFITRFNSLFRTCFSCRSFRLCGVVVCGSGRFTFLGLFCRGRIHQLFFSAILFLRLRSLFLLRSLLLRRCLFRFRSILID